MESLGAGQLLLRNPLAATFHFEISDLARKLTAKPLRTLLVPVVGACTQRTNPTAPGALLVFNR